MKAMVFEGAIPVLREVDISSPAPCSGELLLQIKACAVCRTDLHLIDGELPNPKIPVVPGHEIVGKVLEIGEGVRGFTVGQRVGVPWLAWTCGSCQYCRMGLENLCNQARFTGYTVDGGYAEFAVADARYCFPIPEEFSDADAAPLLCAGLIGYRCLRKAGDAKKLGIYGFGAAAHIITQVAQHQGREVFAFTRKGDTTSQTFARSLGAVWAGNSAEAPPCELDAAIIFAPVGDLIPIALKHVRRAGVVICGGIHMSDIPKFSYEVLWGERTICSVANLTRRDGDEFLELAAKIPVRTAIEKFPLSEANEALNCLRRGQLKGAAVLCPELSTAKEKADRDESKART